MAPLVCPGCGESHPPDERFCRSCAMPLVYSGSAEVEEPVSPRHERARKVDPRYTEGDLVRAAGAMNQAEAEFVQGLLLEEGIPSTLRRTRGFDVPDMLAAGPRDVMVPASGHEAAREVLLEAEIVRDEPVEETAPSRVLAVLLGVLAIGALVIWLGTELAAAATVSAVPDPAPPAGGYTACQKTGAAIIVEVAGASCDDARTVATALTGVPAGGIETALGTQGWTALRASATGFDDSYELFATRGLAALWVRLPGDAPDLDGWMGNRQLVFARGALVPGAPPPSGAVVCTSSFLIRMGERLGGLSAAHCAALSKRKRTLRRNAALRRPPQPGLVLGTVRRNLARTRRLDVIVLPVPSGPGRPAAAVVDRGILAPPLFVRGSARPRVGQEICFSGSTSGIDQCGEVVRRYPGVGRRTCTSITGREGDSGSPVYTRPGSDGTVRAVGIASVVFGPFASMCFTPIGPVLDALDATLVTAPG